MSGPTPGPWHWDDMTIEGHKRMREKGRKKLPGVTFARELVSTDKWVMGSGADFYDCGPFDLVIATEADANLIAASPTMYDYIVKRAAEGDEDAQRIKENIDAAEGVA